MSATFPDGSAGGWGSEMIEQSLKMVKVGFPISYKTDPFNTEYTGWSI